MRDSSPRSEGTVKRERDDAITGMSSEGIVVTVPLSEQDVSFRKNPLDAVFEMVIDDGVLPPYCCVCAKAGSPAKKVRFSNPLPIYFWYAVIGGPIAIIVASLVAIAAPSEAAEQILVAVATLVGLGVGLPAGWGAFRRGRNVMTVYLCDEHSVRFRKLNRLRIVAKTLFVTVMVAIVAWLPMTVLAIVIDGPMEPAVRIILGASGPTALVVTILLLILCATRLAHYHGLAPRLEEDGVRLVFRNSDFAEQVTNHVRSREK